MVNLENYVITTDKISQNLYSRLAFDSRILRNLMHDQLRSSVTEFRDLQAIARKQALANL